MLIGVVCIPIFSVPAPLQNLDVRARLEQQVKFFLSNVEQSALGAILDNENCESGVHALPLVPLIQRRAQRYSPQASMPSGESSATP